LELVFHHWIEKVQWVLDNDGDYFREQVFCNYHSFQFCSDRSVATTYRSLRSNRFSTKITFCETNQIQKRHKTMDIFTEFTKCVEGNIISYCNRFPVLAKLLALSGSLGANKHAETLMRAVSERFSRTTD
jgi:hypothetical protein